MSLNFDVNSNLFLVRRFHTMEKLQKRCQFYSDNFRFFCNQLYILVGFKNNQLNDIFI
jgi:hypothetical protein